MSKKKKQSKRLNGEGSIRRRKDGRFEFRYYGEDPKTGEQKRLSFIETDEQIFMDKVFELRRKTKSGIKTEYSKMTLWEWICEWLTTYKMPKGKNTKSIRNTTFDSYETVANKHIKNDPIANKPIGTLQSEDLQKYYDRLLVDDGKEWLECRECHNKLFKDENPENFEKLKAKQVKYRHCLKCKGPMEYKKGTGLRTVHYLRTQIIGGALKKAVATRKIEYNPNVGTEIATLEYAETQPFSIEQIMKFLDIIETDKYGLAIKTDIGTALRIGELLALQWPNMDLDNGVIKVTRTVVRIKNREKNAKTKTKLHYNPPKTKKSEGSVQIPELLIPQIQEYQKKQLEHIMSIRKTYKDNGLVFANDIGTQIDPKNFRKHYKSLLKKAGLPYKKFHALRHSYGAMLLELGEDLKVIQEMMRHEELATTSDIYVKVVEKLKKRAASKLNILFARKEGVSI